ncbi:MAG: hypothetical protein ABJJ37_26105 [Roseibium sp.]
MARAFSETAFTKSVRAMQERNGSRSPNCRPVSMILRTRIAELESENAELKDFLNQ